jgi:hypothetical protein
MDTLKTQNSKLKTFGTMRYLTPTELIAIHSMLLGEFGGMRGITEAGFGRLEAAAAAPQASMFGE